MRLLSFSFLLTLLISGKLTAQITNDDPIEEDWSIEPAPVNCNAALGLGYRAAYDRNILPMDDMSSVVLLNYGKGSFGVANIYRLRVMWQKSVPGIPLGIGKIGGNVVVFYRQEEKSADVHAALIDTKLKQIVKDNIVYRLTDKVSDYMVENTPSGKFDHLVIRVPDFSHQSVWTRKADDVVETKKLQLVYIDENLSAKVIDITNDLDGGSFIATATAETGDHFITVLQQKSLVIRKYGPDGKTNAQLSTDFSYRDVEYAAPICVADKENPAAVCLSIKYKNGKKDDVINTLYADFATNTILTTGETALNKDYKNTLKEKVQKNRDIQSASFDYIDNLYPVQIIAAAGKIIVIKEINEVHVHNQHLVVDIYDKMLRPLNTIVIDRNLQTFTHTGHSIGAHVKDEILYIVSSTLTGPAKLGVILSEVNIKTNTFVKNTMLDKGRVLKEAITEGNATMWFNDCFITSELRPHGSVFKMPEFTATLRRFVYQ